MDRDLQSGDCLVTAPKRMAEFHEPCFSDLKKRIAGAGLLTTARLYYLRASLTTALLMASGWIAFHCIGDSWWQLAVAPYLGFAYVQTALLLHDAGHRQIFRRKNANELTCLILGNLLIGVNASWWVPTHNRHHSHPNHVAKDPFVDKPSGWQSTIAGTRRSAIIARSDASLFLAGTLLFGLGFQVLGIYAAVKKVIIRHMLPLAAYFVLYVSVLGSTLSLPKAAFFALAHYSTIGAYLGAVLLPNHVGMDVRTGTEPEWVQRQVLTSRNLRGGIVLDYLFGGLNLQIEHHLFPTMARPHLRRAAPIVRSYCQEHDLRYYETTVLNSYREIWHYLLTRHLVTSDRRDLDADASEGVDIFERPVNNLARPR